MSDTGSITRHDDPAARVATITFAHPAHNSMSAALLAELVRQLDAVSHDDGVRAVILRSGGDRTFCAGANFDELLAIDNKVDGERFFLGFASVILAIRRCAKPIVVAVQGKAIGGGVGIAAAADYCLATEAAAVRLSELAIAIGPFVILPAVQRKLGAAATSELCLDTEWHDADWAHRYGLFQRVYADQTQLMDAAEALATKLAGYSPAATTRLKHSLWYGTDDWPELLAARAKVTGELVLGKEARAALSAFKKK